MSKIKLVLEVVNDLKSLAESIETLVHVMEANEVEAVKEVPKKKPKSKAKTEEPEPEVEEVPEEKQPSLEELRAVMADKSRDGFRAEVKAILTKYGANNLSSLDPKHYLSAMKEVGELK